MYLVIEIQTISEQQIAVPTPIYSNSDRKNAESEFHRLCSVAAVSQLPRHTILMIDDAGVFHRVESYTNE